MLCCTFAGKSSIINGSSSSLWGAKAGDQKSLLSGAKADGDLRGWMNPLQSPSLLELQFVWVGYGGEMHQETLTLL